MSWLIALAAFLATIIVVVGVHEWGHYLAARAFGVRVLRFSIGFGRPLLAHTGRNGTEWVLAPFPFGGYVRMLESPADAQASGADPREALDAKPRWQRAIVVAAGPAANFVLAFILFFCVALQGSEGLRARVGSVVQGSMAEQAGFRPGDEVTMVNGREVTLWGEVYEEMLVAVANRDLDVEVLSGAAQRKRFLPLSELPPAAVERDLLEAVGMRPDTSYLKVQISGVVPDSPAAAAGLLAGDMILAVDGEVVERWARIVELVEAAPGREIELVVLRDGLQHVLQAVPEPAAQQGGVGKLGVMPTFDAERHALLVTTREHGLSEALGIALRRTTSAVEVTFRFIGHLLGRRMSVASLSGPVGIANHAGTAASLGLLAFLVFLAHISISLGALNLLPIPLLDGGHLVQYAVEGMLRRPLPDIVVGFARIIGGVLIIFLMSLAVYSDLT